MTGSDGVPEIATALAAWTNPPSASIVLHYGGTTTQSGQGPFSHIGVITFEDPSGDLPSGALAIGGGWATSTGGKIVNGQQFGVFTSGFVIFEKAASIAVWLRSSTNFARILEHELGHTVGLDHSNAGSANIMYYACCAADTPVPPAIGTDDLAALNFVYPGVPASPADSDHDGLPDAWEGQFGLNPLSAAGNDGPNGDPDHDGKMNLEEYLAGTHPRGFVTRYFAEGATGFFDCYVALLNPDPTRTAHVLLRFQRDDGVTLSQAVSVPPLGRRTVVAKAVAGLASASFSTVVESDVPVVADRTMTWDGNGYGSHAEGSIAAPATTWYLAEGATFWNFALYYLLQNPSPTTDADVEITYLRPAPQPPVVKQYTARRNSRTTIWVNGEGAELANTDVSAKVVSRNGVPIIVERAMWWPGPPGQWQEAHNSPGMTTTGMTWALADGEVGGPRAVETYILIANTSATAGQAKVTLLFEDGAPSATVTVPLNPNSRRTIYPPWDFPGQFPAGSHRTFGTIVESVGPAPVPIVVERAMCNDALGIHWAAGTGAAAMKLR